MPSGIVKWFDDYKGYGFIHPDEGGEDIFAHISNLSSSEEQYSTLYKSDRVSFDVIETEKGLEAENIKIVKESPNRHKKSKPLFNIPYKAK
ncbi:MAG: cold-shock protein [Candidatus Lokiarchaeota archaeon]|nr:cold-shock protein [Candidatus Lokiarchaeota archaeon]